VRGQEGLLHSLKSHFVVSFSPAMMPLLRLMHVQIYYWTSLLLRCSCCEICTGLPHISASFVSCLYQCQYAK
jgi:hypothetical protein